MKEHPIIFKGEMVRAILDGRKTQTRRVIKPQPIGVRNSWSQDVEPNDRFIECGIVKVARESRGRNMAAAGILTEQTVKGPYGKVGDRLWVREGWWHEIGIGYENAAFENGDFVQIDGKTFHIPDWKPTPKVWRKRPSIHMFKWACRLWLTITDIRVERVQDISEDDVCAEGFPIEQFPPAELARLDRSFAQLNDITGTVPRSPVVAWFRHLWDSINKKRGYSWESNPWTWVVEFEKVEK